MCRSVMSPRKKRTTQKRGASQLDQNSPQKPTSPSQSNPNKKQIMSNDTADKILEMLNNINQQNEGIKIQLEAQKIEIANNTEMLKHNIAESHKELKNEMNTLVENLKSEFKTEIVNINKKIDSSSSAFAEQIKVMNNKSNDLDSRVAYMEKDSQRLSLLNELKLTGIPVTDNENLTETFVKLANVIEYDTSNASNIPHTTRLITYNKITRVPSMSSTVILKFAAIHMKESFFGQYLRLLPKKKITSKDLGFATENRIIIGENLSSTNQELFKAASIMKHDKKLAQVFTINGIVNVKVQRGGKTYEIRHKQQLETLTHTATSSNPASLDTSNATITPDSNNINVTNAQTPANVTTTLNDNASHVSNATNGSNILSQTTNTTQQVQQQVNQQQVIQ